MTPVTIDEMKLRCPMVLVECLGKRVLARTSHRDGKALLTIIDNAILSRIDGDGTFCVEWQQVADAMNNSRPIFLLCEERK